MPDSKVITVQGRMGTRADPRVYVDFTLSETITTSAAVDEEYLPTLKVEYRTWIGSGAKTNWAQLVEYANLKFTSLVLDVSSIPYDADKNIEFRLSTKNADASYSSPKVATLDTSSFLGGLKSSDLIEVGPSIVGLLVNKQSSYWDFPRENVDYRSIWQKPYAVDNPNYNVKTFLGAMQSGSKARAFAVVGNSNIYFGLDRWERYSDLEGQDSSELTYIRSAVILGLSLTGLDISAIPGYPNLTAAQLTSFENDAETLFEEWYESVGHESSCMFMGVGDESLGGVASTAFAFARKDRGESPKSMFLPQGVEVYYDNLTSSFTRRYSEQFWRWVESRIGYQLNVGSTRRQGTVPATKSSKSAIVFPKDASENAVLMLHNFQVWPPEDLDVNYYSFD